MDRSQLLQLDALLQQVGNAFQGVKRNPNQPGPADHLDSIVAFVKATLAQPAAASGQQQPGLRRMGRPGGL